MPRTSTIRIRQTKGGTTIRATGSAAHALFSAITAAAESAAAKSAPNPIAAEPAESCAQRPPVDPLILSIEVRHVGAGIFFARPVHDDAAFATGVHAQDVRVRTGATQAIDEILMGANPQLKRGRLLDVNDPDLTDPYSTITYIIEVEELNARKD